MPFGSTLARITESSHTIIDTMVASAFFNALQDKEQSVSRDFITQDRPYLKMYVTATRRVIARMREALLTGAAVLFDASDIEKLELVATHVDDYERSLAGADNTVFACTAPSNPAIIVYMRHLDETTRNNSLEEAIACLTPCMYIYHHHLGPLLQQLECAIDNPDQMLIESFYDQGFIDDANILEELLDKITSWSEAQQVLEEKVCHIFLRSCECECAFFASLKEHDLSMSHDPLFMTSLV
jgi:thiaminase